MSLKSLLALCAVVVVGVMSMASLACTPLHKTSTTAPISSPTTADATLIVSDIVNMASGNNPFLAILTNDLPAHLDATRLFRSTMLERSLHQAIGARVYVLHYSELEETIAGGMYNQHTSQLRFEADLFEVTGLPPVSIRDATSNRFVNVFDTTRLVPLFKKEFFVTFKYSPERLYASGHSVKEIAEYRRQIADEICRQLIAQTFNELAAAVLHPASPPPPPPAPAPPAPVPAPSASKQVI